MPEGGGLRDERDTMISTSPIPIAQGLVPGPRGAISSSLVCGRVYRPGERDLQRFLEDTFDERVRWDPGRFPAGEAFPTEELLVLLSDGARMGAEPMRWGITPTWKRDGKAGRPLINARAETLTEKPIWSRAFRERRCAVPVAHFYEWQSAAPKPRPRYTVRLRDSPITVLAGLWADDAASATGRACTIITTTAGEVVRPIHERQPVILPVEHLRRWLDPGITERGPLEDLLRPLGGDSLVAAAESGADSSSP